MLRHSVCLLEGLCGGFGVHGNAKMMDLDGCLGGVLMMKNI